MRAHTVVRAVRVVAFLVLLAINGLQFVLMLGSRSYLPLDPSDYRIVTPAGMAVTGAPVELKASRFAPFPALDVSGVSLVLIVILAPITRKGARGQSEHR